MQAECLACWHGAADYALTDTSRTASQHRMHTRFINAGHAGPHRTHACCRNLQDFGLGRSSLSEGGVGLFVAIGFGFAAALINWARGTALRTGTPYQVCTICTCILLTFAHTCWHVLKDSAHAPRSRGLWETLGHRTASKHQTCQKPGCTHVHHDHDIIGIFHSPDQPKLAFYLHCLDACFAHKLKSGHQASCNGSSSTKCNMSPLCGLLAQLCRLRWTYHWRAALQWARRCGSVACRCAQLAAGKHVTAM